MCGCKSIRRIRRSAFFPLPFSLVRVRRNVCTVWRAYLEGVVKVTQSRIAGCDGYRSQVSEPIKTFRGHKEQQLKKVRRLRTHSGRWARLLSSFGISRKEYRKLEPCTVSNATSPFDKRFFFCALVYRAAHAGSGRAPGHGEGPDQVQKEVPGDRADGPGCEGESRYGGKVCLLSTTNPNRFSSSNINEQDETISRNRAIPTIKD